MFFTKKKRINGWNRLLNAKIMVFLFLGIMLQANVVGAESQINGSLSLKIENKTIEEVIVEIERKSDYSFFYEDETFNKLRIVSLDVRDKSVEEIIVELFQEGDNTAIIDKKQVYIVKKEQTTPQKLMISGVVKDQKGEVLIGASIREVGTNNITVSDVNGRFTLYNIKNEESILNFTYIGFVPLNIKVGKESELNVVMEEDTKGLEEVVIVGYGQQKRESVVGAISTVSPSTLRINQSRSVSNALAGNVTGVIAVQRSGEPGKDASDFWIRGISSFQSVGTQPLVLVDGIERSLNDISPEEIESFSMLKDATATAVYGVRGANGVILIQTKKGKLGKPRVSVKADYGISTPTKLPEFVDGATYMEVMNAAHTLSGGNGYMYAPDVIEMTRTGADPDLYPSVNWLKATTKDYVPNGRVSLDINGGSERLRYSLIVAMYSEKGITKTDKNVDYDASNKLTRYNVRSNVDIDVTSSTNVAVSIGGYIMNRNEPGTAPSEIIGLSFKNTPIVHPILYSNGQIPATTSQTNPWAASTNSGYQSYFQSSIQSLFAVTQDIGALYKPLEGLRVNAKFSFDTYNWHNQKRTKSPTTYFANGRDDQGNLLTSMTNKGSNFLGYSKESGGNRYLYFEGQLAYNKTIADKHRLDALFLYNMSDKIDADAGSAIASLPYRTQGLAGRVSYGLNDTYFIEANFGFNGSENFRSGKRWGFFPSIAAGWLISNESFMESISNTISKLKIRSSYGLVGNDRLGGRRFSYLSTIDGANGYNFGISGSNALGGYQEGDFGIPDLTWETVKKFNFGVELGLIDAIELQTDVFHERREDIFMQRKTIPELSGFTKAPWANYGITENKGFELTLDMNKSLSKDWFISARGSFTYATNEIIEYDEAESMKNTTRSRTGQPVHQYYGLEAIGLFQEEDFDANGNLLKGIPEHTFSIVKPGDIRYNDTNNDGRIDAYDEKPIGKPYVPEIVYGFGLSVTYKNFDISAFFQGTGNFSNRLGGAQLIPGSGGGGLGNIYTNYDDRWKPEDPYKNVFWPRIASSVSNNNSYSSTWWLQDASYLRLKNFEMGYTLPKGFQKKAAMRNARVFFRASNLLTWSSFKLWDPEIGSSDGLKYPLMKVFSVGFEASF